MSVSTVVDVIDRSVECMCEIGLFKVLLNYNIILIVSVSRKQKIIVFREVIWGWSVCF